LDYNDSFCSATRGLLEGHGYLFFSCVFYGQLWLLIFGWLGI